MIMRLERTKAISFLLLLFFVFVFLVVFFGWFLFFLKKKKDVPVLQVVFTVPLGRGGNSTFGVCFGLFRTSAVNFVGVLYNI